MFIYPVIQTTFPILLSIVFNIKDNKNNVSYSITKEVMKIFFYSLRLNKEIIIKNKDFSEKWFELFKYELELPIDSNFYEIQWKIRKWIMYIINKIHLSFSHREYFIIII